MDGVDSVHSKQRLGCLYMQTALKEVVCTHKTFNEKRIIKSKATCFYYGICVCTCMHALTLFTYDRSTSLQGSNLKF